MQMDAPCTAGRERIIKTVAEINARSIDQLSIGRTAFYRYFPPDRIRKLGTVHGDGMQP